MSCYFWLRAGSRLFLLPLYAGLQEDCYYWQRQQDFDFTGNSGQTSFGGNDMSGMTYHNIAYGCNARADCQDCQQAGQPNVEALEWQRHGMPLELQQHFARDVCATVRF